ncbi:protein kinase-like domain-containing protein [Artemisia annua]|uniref:Protein kinase-like domain-containing protein n=1 Tax=Artemisia annua TaxID=35608 RepID=A0A2U1QMX6_ARTAN|nr:protein kinase-like domain-containing protein [Artemisia annua]
MIPSGIYVNKKILSATNNFSTYGINSAGYKAQLLRWHGHVIDIFARRLGKYQEGEFWMEVSLLSSLKHKNLVSLVGFCDENDEKIIITKRETRGSLFKYLRNPMMLTWVRRLEISVGIAQALSYIHYDESRDFSVIHRNISRYTVLLNDDWEPKLSHFEYSMKIQASQRHNSFHANTLRIWVNDNHLAPLFIAHYREKKLDNLINRDLWVQIDLHSFNMLAEIAYACLDKERSRRPNIDDIAPRLEKALQLARENRRFPVKYKR